MACDICSKAGVPVESLHDQYTTREIRFVCVECSRAVNEKNGALLSSMLKKKADELKAFMVERRAAKRLARQAALDREAADRARRR